MEIVPSFAAAAQAVQQFADAVRESDAVIDLVFRNGPPHPLDYAAHPDPGAAYDYALRNYPNGALP